MFLILILSVIVYLIAPYIETNNFGNFCILLFLYLIYSNSNKWWEKFKYNKSKKNKLKNKEILLNNLDSDSYFYLLDLMFNVVTHKDFILESNTHPNNLPKCFWDLVDSEIIITMGYSSYKISHYWYSFLRCYTKRPEIVALFEKPIVDNSSDTQNKQLVEDIKLVEDTDLT